MNLKKDALLNTIGNFSYLGALWLMSVLVVRIGNFEIAGYFSLALTTANIYVSIASYTVRLYYAADIEENFKDNQYIWMRIITTSTSLAFCVVGSAAVGYNKYQMAVILLFYFYKMAEMISDILFGVLQRHGKLYLSGYSMIIKSVLSLIAFLSVLFLSKSLIYSLIAIDAVALVILIFIDVPLACRYGEKCFCFEMEDIRKIFQILKVCFPLFVVGLCYNIIPSIPRLAFERIYDAEQFGVYSSISTITVLISTAVNCVIVPVIPKFAEFYRNRKKNLLRNGMGACLLGVLGIGAAALLCAGVCGEPVLILLFGQRMRGTVGVFQLIIVATVFTSLIICFNAFFTAVGQQKFLLYGCITGTVLCVVSAIPLCRGFYMNGVAFNLILSQGIEIFILLAGVYWVLKKIS